MLKSRLAVVIKESGLRITDVIDRSHLARETVFRAKKDATISSCTLGTLKAIAEALGVHVKDLFEEE